MNETKGTNMTLSTRQQAKIANWLGVHDLPSGLGDMNAACSIASINLALTGTLTDQIPDCMSLVIGKWIIGVQDAMPDDMRNSSKWKGLLPLAAGTGRLHERECAAVILEWMWATVLPSIADVADAGGYGAEWRAMCVKRTAKSARIAADAAAATYATAADAAAYTAAAAAAYATAAAATAAYAAAAYAAAAAAAAADAAADAAAYAATHGLWEQWHPAALLAELIDTCHKTA